MLAFPPLMNKLRISVYLLFRVGRAKMAPVTPRSTGSICPRSGADGIPSRTQPNVLLMSHTVAFTTTVASTHKRYSSSRGHAGVLNISKQNFTQESRADGADTTGLTELKL
jgi:hypothetical protein